MQDSSWNTKMSKTTSLLKMSNPVCFPSSPCISRAKCSANSLDMIFSFFLISRAGTIVDQQIICQGQKDFYLCAHKAIQVISLMFLSFLCFLLFLLMGVGCE